MSKFDDAVTALKAAHYDTPEMVQLLELVVEQNERIKNLEHFTLEAKHRLGTVEGKQDEHTQSINSLAASRTDYDKRVHVIETKPEHDNKKLDELAKRVTVVEGAVGSKAYKRADVKLDKPDDEPKPAWAPPPLPHTTTGSSETFST